MPARFVHFFVCFGLLPLTAVASLLRTEEDRDQPLDLELEERVEVRMVLIDAIVLDARNKTVGGLEAEDFDLLVDDKAVEISSLDRDCPLGGAADPPVNAERQPMPTTTADSPRRYVFVLDYYHIGTDYTSYGIAGASPVEILERVREALDRLHLPGEQYMLISLGQILRVEVPFTADVEEFSRGIDRMIRDRGLYAGFYERLTERRWFDRVLSLLDLMELIPGRKSVVLFSGPFFSDGWAYDETLWRIAAMSGRARTAFYPVDSRGLVDSRGFVTSGGSILGPPMLGRLAVETGGRSTGGTNDLARGFARAQRDQGCSYTVGFYDQAPRLDGERKVRLFVRRTGHRVVHPTFYVVRSAQQERSSRALTAAMVPAMFATDAVSARLLLVRAHSESRWIALSEVRIEPGILGRAPSAAEWSVKGSLRRLNGTVHQRFDHRVSGPARPGEALELFAQIQPRPGRYTLNVVVSHPEIELPLATTTEVIVPEVPLDDLLVVGPLQGTEAPRPAPSPTR